MTEILLYAVIGILIIELLDRRRYGRHCYKLGVLSATGALNVLCEESNNGFIFYNLLTDVFLCQSTTYDEGVAILKQENPYIDIVVSMATKTRIIDEAI